MKMRNWLTCSIETTRELRMAAIFMLIAVVVVVPTVPPRRPP